MITHLPVPALQTGKSEYKKVDGFVRTILWILRCQTSVPEPGNKCSSLSDPSWALTWKCTGSPPMCPDPRETRSCQSRHPASSRSTFDNLALGQCGGVPSITPPPKYAKSISQKEKHSIMKKHLRDSSLAVYFHQPNWNSQLLYLFFSAVIWSCKHIFWVVQTTNCHLLVGIFWEGSFLHLPCVCPDEVNTRSSGRLQ